ncbi:Transmembrane protein [Parasponia andersonii]|uniref:Transmembrane protein n=1 Tax=Parasponia andersonii TaxID=3476 RepID=A0A2P5BWC6_PARAD|nr:Transmembrane protein [Parasponia andersonii]
MESSSSASSEIGVSSCDYLNLLVLRPALAISFVLFLIFLGWLLAWKLVLVHVPLVQEIFGLRKKPSKPKPPTRRLSKIYSNIEAHNSASS